MLERIASTKCNEKTIRTFKKILKYQTIEENEDMHENNNQLTYNMLYFGALQRALQCPHHQKHPPLLIERI